MRVFRSIVDGQRMLRAAMAQGERLNRLKAITGDFSCDVALMGHVHTKTTDVITRLELTKSGEMKCKNSDIGVGGTGTYLRTYQKGVSGYGEKALYPPTSIGAIEIILTPRQNEVRVLQ